MTHEEILTMLGDYVDYLIANSSAEAPMWNIEKVRSGKPNKWMYSDGHITDHDSECHNSISPPALPAFRCDLRKEFRCRKIHSRWDGHQSLRHSAGLSVL